MNVKLTVGGGPPSAEGEGGEDPQTGGGEADAAPGSDAAAPGRSDAADPPDLPPPPEDVEEYYLRLFFVRHGYSCANVPWNACSVDQAKLTKEGMDASGATQKTSYAEELESINKVLKRSELTKGAGHLELDKEFEGRGEPLTGEKTGWTGGRGARGRNSSKTPPKPRTV